LKALRQLFTKTEVLSAGISRERELRSDDLFVSGFNEDFPNFPGGIWIVRDGQLLPLYAGHGVFGLAWSEKHKLLLGITRVDQPRFIAFKLFGGRLKSLDVRCDNYQHARRAHGIHIHKDNLYVVATQGGPDARLCTNADFSDHHVGSVIVSKMEMTNEAIMLIESVAWNPYECDHHHHYNDILVNDEFIYLASFSTCDANKNYNNGGAVTRFAHDFSDRLILTDTLVAPHSLEILDGKLYVCSSGASSVISILLDPARPSTRLEFKTLNNFVRGLRVTRDHFWIGLSRSAGRTNSSHLTEPINGILKFNRRDGTTVRIAMPSDCDNVYSIV
jgi:hypothetical protein